MVLAMLMAAVIPRFARTAQRLRLEQTAFAFTQLLRYAHTQSVMRGQTIFWVWDDDRRRAHLEILLDDGSRVPFTDRVATSRVLEEGMSVRLTRGEQAVEEVPFFPDGTSESTTLRMALPAHSYTVTVDRTTSRAVLRQGVAP